MSGESNVIIMKEKCQILQEKKRKRRKPERQRERAWPVPDFPECSITGVFACSHMTLRSQLHWEITDPSQLESGWPARDRC